MTEQELTALKDEDAKLVTLARGARGRANAAQGAAVRDTDGRTYAGATVSLPSLTLTAVQVAVATALASAADGLEAAVVVGVGGVDSVDHASRDVLRDLGLSELLLAGPDGAIHEMVAL